jgi:hypothetical protein
VTRLVIVAAIVVVAVVVAAIVRRVRTPDAPTQHTYDIPPQLDRHDFDRPEAPWLVAVFTSSTCDRCRDVVGKAAALESDQVAVVDVEFTARRDLHRRYGIEAVPMVAIADADGVTRAGFLGPITATDLWAAVAELREPGSTPGACRHDD